MSCLDVMYQSAYQPYQHYPFYQRHFTQKFGHYKMQEPPDHDPNSTPHTQTAPPTATATSPSYPSSLYPHHHHHHSNNSNHSSPPANTTSQPHQHSVKKEDKSAVNDAESTVEAEYINSRCVLFTYYTGELNKVVDEHFSRALSQPSSFPSDGRVGVAAEDGGGGQDKQGGDRSPWNNKNSESIVPPMCQRNLPASFWNSNYYNHTKYHHHHHHHTHHTTTSSCQGPTSNTTHPPHHDALFSDPYPSSLHRSVHQPDPWHYPFASQSSYSHRSSIHDLSYGMASGSSAFNPRYSSLLIQPSVRPGRLPTMPGQCDFTKGGESWHGSYTAHGHTQQLSSDIAPYGMETATSTAMEASDTSKDLYWF